MSPCHPHAVQVKSGGGTRTFVDLQSSSHADQLWDPLLGFADKDGVRECHASLASRAKGSANLHHRYRVSSASQCTRTQAAGQAAVQFKMTPTSWFSVAFLLASGMTTPWFLAPMFDCEKKRKEKKK